MQTYHLLHLQENRDDADDDFGFNETSSFFEDAKTFDPTSGSDVNKTNE